MYNTEKYIGALLESLLAQTFQDFEVIIVDDCSTDNSCVVVENYIPKFGGRLKLSQMQKNSGGPGAPSNKAVALSRGKYVYVMDNDDLLVKNALEILHTYAEEFNAEVVNTSKVIEFFSEEPFPKQDNIIIRNWGDSVDVPTFESEDFAERAKKLYNGGLTQQAWSKLVRRDFLIENEITFLHMSQGQDGIWSFQLFWAAKKFLHIPQPVYIYRHRTSSISHFNREQGKTETLNDVYLRCCDFFLDFFSKDKFFSENIPLQFDLLEKFAGGNLDQALKGYLNTPIQKNYEKLLPKTKEFFGKHGDLIAYLCTSANLSHLKERILTQRIIELENKLKQLQGG